MNQDGNTKNDIGSGSKTTPCGLGRESTLTKIIIVKRASGLYDCTRIRKDEFGESAVGFKSLEEVFRYLRAHDQAEQKVKA